MKEIYTLDSQYNILKKSKELIHSSRMLLDKDEKILPRDKRLLLAEIVKKQELVAFLPSPLSQEITKYTLQSDILSKLDVTCCLNWEEFYMSLLRCPKLILFHVSLVIRHDVSLEEFINMMETLMKCMPGCNDTRLVMIVTKSTDVSIVRALKKSSVIGLCPEPYDFGTNEVDIAIAQLINLNPYWPEHIINQLEGAKPKKVNTIGVKLTPKQNEVLNLIQSRGASNKTIARIMGISESTVKIHVGAILKVYGLRNRTQLALASTDSLKA